MDEAHAHDHSQLLAFVEFKLRALADVVAEQRRALGVAPMTQDAEGEQTSPPRQSSALRRGRRRAA
ncbi:MAG: hypothetical protein ACR2NB_09550, partial [Solirubrobacteraceae bacterium]